MLARSRDRMLETLISVVHTSVVSHQTLGVNSRIRGVRTFVRAPALPGEGRRVGGPERRSAGLSEKPAVSLPQEGATAWSQDGTFPQRCPSTPSSEAGQYDGPALSQPGGPGTGNPLLAPPVPSTEHFGQGVRLLPSGEPRAAAETAGLPTPPSRPLLPNVAHCRFARRRVEGTCLASMSALSLPMLAPLFCLVAFNIHLGGWPAEPGEGGGGEGSVNTAVSFRQRLPSCVGVLLGVLAPGPT